MLRGIRIPIRFKILIAVLLIVTAVVSAITFTMAQLFHADKKVYVSDLTSVLALHGAEEADAILNGYHDRLEVCARLPDDPSLPPARKSAVMEDVLRGFHGFVALSFYERGAEVATVSDNEALREGGLSPADLGRYREQHPLPVADIEAGRMFVENSTISERLPTLTVAIAHRRTDHRPPLVVCAVLRLDELLRLSARSQAFDLFLVDGRGTLVSHRDHRRVARRERLAGIPTLGPRSAAIVKEFSRGGVERIGGYAPVGSTDLVAGAEIPKAAAYFASRDLINRLLIVALALLIVTAVVSMFWSQSLTQSIGRLVRATRAIGRGQFDVNVTIETRDEIGALAEAFNQMGGELSARERALKDAQAQLIQSEKMAAFGQLGAGVAHEIKNPLAGILGLIQLLQRQAHENPTFREGLATMEKETKRCKTIIDNLLKFARQERVELEHVDVGAVIGDAVSIMSHQLALNRVKLSKSVAEGVPAIKGNANQLQQVLMNLILNAQQAMSGNPGEVVVEAGLGADGRVVVKVTDNGPGIPKDIQRRIFEPFFTTKPTGQGTGLGLSVSYGIVQDHKGTIEVESEVGKGTAFIIRLPASAVAEATPAAGIETRRQAA
jgi:signal transduction histidine kinase